MEKERHSITLGYDGSGWTSAEVEAEIRSMSEPDRKVPLMMQLVGTPDIFDCSIAEGAQEKVKAKVSLKSAADIPQDCKGSIELIADPATEMMMGMMQAMSPIAMPTIEIPQMRATVDVLLVPYDLKLRWNDSEVRSGQALPLDGDGKSIGKLTAEMVKVDGKGNPVGEPTGAQFKLTTKFKEEEWVKVQHSATGKRLSADFTSAKVFLEQGSKTLGSVVVEAQVEGHTVRRELSLELSPITLTLTRPAVTELKPGELGKVEVHAVNSKNQPVAGVNISWSMSPEKGQLSATKGVTDQNGVMAVTYTAPDIDSMDASNESVTITATAGAEKEWHDDVSFTFLFVRTITVAFSKKGFQGTSHTFEVSSAGPLTITCGVKDYPFQAASVVAKCEGVSAVSDSYGRVTLPLTKTGTAQDLGKVELPLAAHCLGWVTRIEADFKRLKEKDSTTSALEKSEQEVLKFAKEDYIKRLAAEPEESFDATMINIKMLAATVRVGYTARGLLKRRYQHLSQQLEAFLINLAGAIFSVYGEKIFAKIADVMGAAARKLFGWLAGKCSGSKRMLSWVGEGTGKLKSLLASVDDKIQSLRGRLSKAGAPNKIRRGIPGTSAKGPFKVEGEFLDLKAWKKALQETQEAVAKSKSNLDDLNKALRQQMELAQANKNRIAKKAQKRIAELEAQITNAKASLSKLEEGLKETADPSSQMMFEDLLGTIFSCFNRIILMGQLALAWFVLTAMELSEHALKSVVKEWHPRIGGSLSNMITDKVYKPLFQLATGTWVGMGLGKVIEYALVWTQSNGIASTLDSTLTIAARWDTYDTEAPKEALKYYYNEIDAASFKLEASEIWAEYIADVLDWIEFVIVWGIRISNVVVGILSILVSWISFGTSIIAWFAFSAAVTTFTEAFDTFWDMAKAAARGITSVAGLAEVIGVILPAHAAFAGQMYSDESLYDAATRGWQYPIEDELHAKMSSLPKEAPSKVRKVLAKVEKLKLEDSLPVKAATFVKDTDVTTPFRSE